MNRMHLVPYALAGLVGLTGIAGAIILAVTLDGDAGAKNAGAPPAKPAYSGAPTPARLVGTWSTSSVSTINYRDRLSGSFAPPSGSIFTYKIAANGTFEYSGYMQSSMYHCTIVVFRWQRGTLAANVSAPASGGTLALTSREGKLYYKDSCRAGSEKEKAIVDEPARYSFTIETESGKEVMVMKKANGEHWGKFYRK